MEIYSVSVEIFESCVSNQHFRPENHVASMSKIKGDKISQTSDGSLNVTPAE